jgi:hypothetical protein
VPAAQYDATEAISETDQGLMSLAADQSEASALGGRWCAARALDKIEQPARHALSCPAIAFVKPLFQNIERTLSRYVIARQ